MKRISATQFKAQCLALLDEAAAGEEIVVTKHGQPWRWWSRPSRPPTCRGA